MQAQYRAYAQPQIPQRSPHATTQRRGGIGPMMPGGSHAAVPMSQAQMAQQQQAQAHASEMAKRRSRKPTDKTLPDGAEETIIDPEIAQRYGELRSVEKQLDSTMTRKRLDVVDAAQRPSKVRKTLRVWITNSVENQIWQSNGLNVDSFDFNSEMNATYRVKMVARLLDAEQGSDRKGAGESDEDNGEGEEGDKVADADGGDNAGTIAAASPKFSHFFKAINVDFDQSQLHSAIEHSVEWKKPDAGARGQPAGPLPPAAEFDEFAFRRNGDENMNITIQLVRHESPERYQLSRELADVVDMTEATQQEAVMGLWEYIRLFGLQEDEEKRNFRCDELLRKVVKRGDVGFIPLLHEYVIQHLRPLPPIRLPYTIRVDEEFHKDPKPTVYDIQVSVDDDMRTSLLPLITNPRYLTMLKEVNNLDDQSARLVQAVSVSKAKHDFFTSISLDPTSFIRTWLSSQKRDLDVIMGEAPRGNSTNTSSDEWRRGGKDSMWATQNARESVNVLLSKLR